MLAEANAKGFPHTWSVYLKLSGPAWLQSALTLGGGSLAGSLYLGVIGGFTLLWLQPMAVILGIIMLGAISYVTLSTGEGPFHSMRKYVNPVLAWGWAAGSLLANMVWAMPQFSLANGVVQQNLLPGVLGPESAVGDFGGKIITTFVILIATLGISFCYSNQNWGVRVYEWTLKIMVMLIVLCFVGVVVRLAFSPEGFSWGAVFSGLVPNFKQFWEPAAAYMPMLDQISNETARQFWYDYIVNNQQNVMIAATATAVGINMTFLMPYSLLARGWDKTFRGLSIFDLSTGMLIPFIFATGCVIIASASQFHMTPVPGLLNDQGQVIADESHAKWGSFQELLASRGATISEEDAALDPEEYQLAAMLLRRDAGDLSDSLAPLTGSTIGNIIFGFGVLGMTLSSITVMMVISGMIICEVFQIPQRGWKYRLACMAACTGALGPFVWSGAQFWLAVPTSVFNYMLLPLAYISFLLMMNSRTLMGDAMPTGTNRIIWNTLMIGAVGLTTIGAVWQVYMKGGVIALGVVAAFVVVVLIGSQFVEKRQT